MEAILGEPVEEETGGAGLSYTEGTLEQFELANKPGALAELAGKLAKKGINIDSAYATMPKGAKKAVVVLGIVEFPFDVDPVSTRATLQSGKLQVVLPRSR